MSSPHHDHTSARSPQSVSDTPTDSLDVRKRLLLFAGIGVLAVIVVVSLRSLTAGNEEHTVTRFGRTQVIQLDVLNGTREAKLAQRVTDYLRTQGFDVVEMGNYKSAPVETTLVLDRTGNIEAAREVARVLGVPESNVRTQIDRSLFLDVSVILGNDFAHLNTR